MRLTFHITTGYTHVAVHYLHSVPQYVHKNYTINKKTILFSLLDPKEKSITVLLNYLPNDKALQPMTRTLSYVCVKVTTLKETSQDKSAETYPSKSLHKWCMS